MRPTSFWGRVDVPQSWPPAGPQAVGGDVPIEFYISAVVLPFDRAEEQDRGSGGLREGDPRIHLTHMPTVELREQFQRLLYEWLRNDAEHPSSLEMLEYSDFRLWLSLEGHADLVHLGDRADHEERFRRYFREEHAKLLAESQRSGTTCSSPHQLK